MAAVPDKAEGDTSKEPEKSRLQRLKDDKKDQDYQPEMPPLECGEHLLDYFWEIGPTLVGTMGEGPLTHLELQACQANTGVEFSQWEVTTLVRLSKAYFSESHRATKRGCKAPWQAGEPVVNLAQMDARNAVRALANL